MGNSPCTEGFSAPSRPKEKIVLKYFPIAGRAEPIRLALLLGQFRYHDERIQGEDWETKYQKQTPWGQVPVLQVGQKHIAQTKAILRFIGKLTKHEGKPMYPKDPMVAARVDEIMDAFDDLWIILAPTFRIENQEQKEEARRELFGTGGQASEKVEKFEKILSDSTNGFVVPEAGFSLADLMYFSFLCVIRSGFVDGLSSSLFKAHIKITEHKEMVANMPVIKAYYQDALRSNPSNVPYYEVFKPGA